MNKKGFTLIELLVVIAIIGILAGIVLASLNSARSKASDAAIKAISAMRTQAELVYDSNNCYADGIAASSGCAIPAVAPGACATAAGVDFDDTIFGEPTVAQAIATAKAQAANLLNACSSTANQTAYAIVTQLKSNTLQGWCIDSTQKSKLVTLASADQAGLTAEVNASGACVE